MSPARTATVAPDAASALGSASSRGLESSSRARQGELTVRIYTYVRHGRWYAEAPRLALMTEGASEAEAVENLLDQTVAYVRTVLNRGWFDRLNRPVSKAHRIELWARVALSKLRFQPAHRLTRLVQI